MKMEGNPQPTWELGQTLRPRKPGLMGVHLPQRGRRKKVCLTPSFSFLSPVLMRRVYRRPLETGEREC